jgi:hydroxymethylbilane synthase
VGGKGLFIKELEVAMMEGQADLAVHSMKDVPMELPEGFGIHVVFPRENPGDAFVSNQYGSIDALPQGSVVGTSSLRRQSQLKAKRPDIVIKDLRGNVNTRLQKLDDGQYDAIILACAGLIRLGMEERIVDTIDTELMLPAVGQGVVGIECRSDDADLIELLSPLNDAHTQSLITAERTMNRKLNGGCQVPIGGHANWLDDQIFLRGLVASGDGKQFITSTCKGTDPISVGETVASDLLAQGADELLNAVLDH